MTDSLAASRTRLLPVATAVALVLVSILVVIDHVRLSHWMRLHRSTVEPVEVAQIEDRLMRLEAALATIRQQPAPLTETAYAAAEKVEHDQLDRMERALTDRLGPADLTPFTERLTRLESEVSRLRHPSPPRARPLAQGAGLPTSQAAQTLSIATSVPSAPDVAPPFTVLGTEVRGSEWFLTLAPPGTQALSQVRVLRVGESEGDWQLKTLDAHTAVFETAGHLQQLPVP